MPSSRILSSIWPDHMSFTMAQTTVPCQNLFIRIISRLAKPCSFIDCPRVISMLVILQFITSHNFDLLFPDSSLLDLPRPHSLTIFLSSEIRRSIAQIMRLLSFHEQFHSLHTDHAADICLQLYHEVPVCLIKFTIVNVAVVFL